MILSVVLLKDSEVAIRSKQFYVTTFLTFGFDVFGDEFGENKSENKRIEEITCEISRNFIYHFEAGEASIITLCV